MDTAHRSSCTANFLQGLINTCRPLQNLVPVKCTKQVIYRKIYLPIICNTKLTLRYLKVWWISVTLLGGKASPVTSIITWHELLQHDDTLYKGKNEYFITCQSDYNYMCILHRSHTLSCIRYLWCSAWSNTYYFQLQNRVYYCNDSQHLIRLWRLWWIWLRLTTSDIK